MLLVGVVVALRIPVVQQFAAERATAYLASKLNTKVAIGRFTTDFENSLVLNDFYLEDRKQDTLIYAHRLGLNLNLVALVRNRLRIRSATIENGYLNIYSTLPDSTYNYNFILKAFSTPKTSGSGSFFYRVGAITLQNCRFRLADPYRGNQVKAKVGYFKADLGKFNSDEPVYDLGEITLRNSYGHFTRSKFKTEKEGENQKKVTFQKLHLKNINLNYHQKLAGRRLYLLVGKAGIHVKEADFGENRMAFDKIMLENVNFSSFEDDPADSNQKKVNQPAGKVADRKRVPIQLSVDQLRIKNSGLILADLFQPAKAEGLDTKHLKITAFTASVNHLNFQKDRFGAEVNSLSLKEKSGLHINAFKGDFQGTNNQFTAKDLALKMGNSQLKGALNLRYPSLEAAVSNPKTIAFTAELRRLQLAWKEIFQMAPSLAKSKGLQGLSSYPLSLSGNFKGSTDQIRFEDLKVNVLANTRLKASGKVQNWGKDKALQMDLYIKNLQTDKTDLQRFLFTGSEPAKINLPEKINLEGRFNGNAAKLNFREVVLTASGGTRFKGNGVLHNLNQPNKKLNLQIEQLKTTRQALLSMLPPGTVSPEVQLPDNLELQGSYNGASVNNFVANARLQSSFGNVQTAINVQPGQQFSGNLSVKDFHVGKLLKQEKTLGKATGEASFRGQGFKIKTMELQFEAFIKKIVYKKETFREIKIEGSLNKNVYDMHGNLKNVVIQGLGHKLKVIKKANPVKIPGKIKRKLGFGKKKKKEEAPPE